MFFTKAQQDRLSKLEILVLHLENRLERQSKALVNLNTRTVSLEDARYGVKIDGTPKAKPGRKAKQ